MEPKDLTTADFSAAVWTKSSRSGNNGGQCVEVASFPGVVLIRDSKKPRGPVLAVTSVEWGSFLHSVKRGDFDT